MGRVTFIDEADDEVYEQCDADITCYQQTHHCILVRFSNSQSYPDGLTGTAASTMEDMEIVVTDDEGVTRSGSIIKVEPMQVTFNEIY